MNRKELNAKCEKINEQILQFFGSAKMWLFSFLLVAGGTIGDDVSTWVNFYLLGDSIWETNRLTAPIITSPLMIVVEIGWFSIIWLIPFTLRRLSRWFDLTSIMGVVFGISRMFAMVHNVTLLIRFLP